MAFHRRAVAAGAWLTQVARNRAKDELRRAVAFRRRLPLLIIEESGQKPHDDRLRLIFACCHPALGRAAQVALTLRLICGLTTAEVARAFLVPEATMAARLTRAKKKIATARIPYRVPEPDQFGERVGVVLDVVHLIFTTGHAPPAGDQIVRRDLVDGAIALARLLHLLMPADPAVAGLLALLLLIDARSATRRAPDGALRLLADQDRTAWNRALIAEGLRRLWPGSPVVELNQAVAIGLRDGPQAGLDALDRLLGEPALATYGYLSAARADFLRRLGREAEAVAAYEEALALTENEAERAFLRSRLD